MSFSLHSWIERILSKQKNDKRRRWKSFVRIVTSTFPLDPEMVTLLLIALFFCECAVFFFARWPPQGNPSLNFHARSYSSFLLFCPFLCIRPTKHSYSICSFSGYVIHSMCGLNNLAKVAEQWIEEMFFVGVCWKLEWDRLCLIFCQDLS